MFCYFLPHQNGTKLGKGFGTCYVNTTHIHKTHGYDLKWLNCPEKNSHTCTVCGQK